MRAAEAEDPTGQQPPAVGKQPGRDMAAAPAEGAGPPTPLFVGEAQLRAILDAIPARVALYDRERRHRYVNREYASFVGRAPEAVVGLTLPEVMGRETYAKLEPFYLQLRPHSARALAGEASRWEGWLPYSAGGAPAFVQRLYVPYRGQGDAVEGYFVFARDLTELKRSEALNAAITAAALDAVIVADEAGRIVAFNPAAEASFGLAQAEALGRPIAELVAAPGLPPLATADGATLDPAAPDPTTGAPPQDGRIEVTARRADGSTFPAELAVAAVRLADRRLFTAYLRDLTPARAAAAEIERQREALLQAEKLAAFGALLAGVAHELNNPLSIVLTGALMLQEDLAAAGQPDFARRAERIRAAGERCARIVRSFLALARQQDAVRRPLAVAALVDAALDLPAEALRAEGIVLERVVEPDLPPVLGDPDQLHQVLSNLLANARQAVAAQDGPRRIGIAARAAGEAVEIAVSDSGPGVPAALRRRIFDPFFTTKPVGEGTGLGLSVSRGIAEAHGGSLALREEAGGSGATFVLRLPARAAAAVPASIAAPAIAPGVVAAPLRGDALVIDDEAEIAAALAGILGGLGLRCRRTTSGRRARRLLAAQDFDVILCDLRMPDLGGEALLAWLEQHRPHLCARTGFVTGAAMGTDALLARTARPVLEKPFMPQEVRDFVARLLAAGRGVRPGGLGPGFG